MNEYRLPKIEKPDDFKHPKAKSLLLKHNLSIEELLDLEKKLYRRNEYKIKIFDAKKDPSMIKEFIATAILYYESTVRDIFLIPCYGLPLSLSFVIRREKSTEWYKINAEEFVKNAKRIERRLKHNIFVYLLREIIDPMTWKIYL